MYHDEITHFIPLLYAWEVCWSITNVFLIHIRLALYIEWLNLALSLLYMTKKLVACFPNPQIGSLSFKTELNEQPVPVLDLNLCNLHLWNTASAYLGRLGLPCHEVRGQHVGGGPHCPLRLLLAARSGPLLEVVGCLRTRLASALCLRLLLLAPCRVDFCNIGKYVLSKRNSVCFTGSPLNLI
jgi:hypothetical protein